MLSSLIPYEVTQTLGRKKYLSDDYTTCDSFKKKTVSQEKLSAVKGVKNFNILSVKDKVIPNAIQLKVRNYLSLH